MAEEITGKKPNLREVYADIIGKEPDPREVYADIIDHPHWVSPKHPPMSLYNRAAQFAPFAALSGYDDMIDE